MKDIYAALFSSVVITVALQCIWIALRAKTYHDLIVSVLNMLVTFLFLLPFSASEEQTGMTSATFLQIKSILLLPLFSVTQWYVFKTKALESIFATLAIAIFSTSISWYLNSYLPDYVWYGIAMLIYIGVPVAAIRIMSPQFANERTGKWMVILFCAYQVALIIWTSLYWPTNSPDALQAVVGSWLFRLHETFFVLSTGCLLIVSFYKQSNLQTTLQQYERRWESFVENSPLLVLELDADGAIIKINSYATSLLGHAQSAELAGQNFFQTFSLPSEMSSQKKIHAEIIAQRQSSTSFTSTIQNKSGRQLIIRWVNFFLRKQHNSAASVIILGFDVTGEEETSKLIEQLQKETEKEKLLLHDVDGFDVEEHVSGKSQAFAYAIQRANQVATTHAPVLLEGETGVGKEVFANFIHRNSSRSDMPFIKVNCAALPKDLIEDELFGHEKGAFTSAIQSRKGRFELADGGTIFLDEIGELPIEMQPKLLRVVQSGEFERIGGQKTIKVDVRILAATNRDLAAEITDGTFRSDLYYRLNVFPITIPPLRSRKEDLPDLIRFFIRKECQKYNKPVEDISKADLQRLVEYPWPGNIRELKNVIERAVIVSEGNTLTVDWWLRQTPTAQTTSDQSLEKMEKEHILGVLNKCNWKINGGQGAAELLGMNPNTLRSRMKRLGITRPPSKATPVLS